MTTDAAADPTPAVDGRRLRRERGRAAVVDAAIELVTEGHTPPAPEAVAERAGVSVASLYRYFETLDDLRYATADVYFERHAHLYEIPDLGEGPLPARIDRMATARVLLYSTTEPVARLVRLQAHHHDTIEQILVRTRTLLADQLRAHFAGELDRLDEPARDDTITNLATLTSFESWELAHRSLGRTADDIVRAWTSGATALLAAR